MARTQTSAETTERTVGYLLLHLAVPSHQHPPSRDHIIAANGAARKIGVKLLRTPLGDSMASLPHYIFHFPRFARDDGRAAAIGESITYAVHLTCGPFGDPSDPFTVFPIPSKLLRSPGSLSTLELINLEESRPPHLRTLDFPALSLSSATGFVSNSVAAAWRAAPPLLDDRKLHDAARFLKDSQDNFYVYPGDYMEVLHNDERQHPASGWERSKVEAAPLASFKAVEAILGSLPSDDRRLRRDLASLGFDPDEPFGLRPEVPLILFLRQMKDARDKRSAHGSTGLQPVDARDLFLYQDCARFLLIRSIERVIGQSLY